jgi:hypothetical protein
MPPSFRVRPALRVPRRAIPERIDAEVLLGVLDAGFEAIEAERRVFHHHRALALVVRDGGDEPVFMQLLHDARVENPTPEPRHRQIQEIREARDPEQAPHVTKHIFVRGHEIFAAAAHSHVLITGDFADEQSPMMKPSTYWCWSRASPNAAT